MQGAAAYMAGKRLEGNCPELRQLLPGDPSLTENPCRRRCPPRSRPRRSQPGGVTLQSGCPDGSAFQNMILDTDRATVATQLTDLETAERVLTRVSKTPPARRPASGGKGRHCHPRPPTKSSYEQVSGTRTRRTEPRRAPPGFGYRQDPTGTLRGVPKRPPEPYRHRSAAPSPCRTDPGA
jgi:hypothetical protein